MRYKINLKPVMTNIVHTGAWEGPCRWQRISVSEEKAQVEKNFIRWSREIKESKLNLNEDVRILEPVHIKFSEDFILRQEEINKLKSDSGETDIYFIMPGGSSIIAFEIGKHFNKPVILLGLGCRNVDIAAYSRSKGYEVFTPYNYDEMNKLVSLLRAKKEFTHTNVLFPTNRGFPAVASVCGITNLQDLEKRHGIVVKKISYKELADEMNSVMKSNLEREKSEKFADELIKNAQDSLIDKKYVVKSVEFYQTVKNLMDRYGCNAFTIECFEFCTSRLPEKWTVVPCLIHTLLKDKGYPSSCEADLGALLAMQLLMSVSKKSSHMGNADPIDENTFRINHSVPGIKMNGYDKPGLPYQLQYFVESGWGTKAVVNFMDNSEKRVTVARVHPSAKKVLVLKGELIGASGWDKKSKLGCSVEAIIKSPNGRKFIERRSDYGNHLSWVYGDYSEEMQKLGEMLNMEVEIF